MFLFNGKRLCKVLKIVVVRTRKPTFKSQKMCPTLEEKTMAAIPIGRQQQRVLKIDHPR